MPLNKKRKTLKGGDSPSPNLSKLKPRSHSKTSKSVYKTADTMKPRSYSKTLESYKTAKIMPSPAMTLQQRKNIIENHVVQTRIPTMLKSMCANSDTCMALGKYHDVIVKYFNNFKDLQFIKSSGVKKIGEDSNNGFVLEVPFEKNGFTAYTVLKCSRTANADNLMYEYIVGKDFINPLVNIYPCFVETFGLYNFNSADAWEIGKDFVNGASTPLDIANLVHKMPDNQTNLADSCQLNKRLCVLIQHFDDFMAVGTACQKQLLTSDIYNVLYQVYFVLAQLTDVYTHYDLHAYNVCIYKPFQGNQYIQMNYHTANGQVISFPSEFIVKIIDYGRNHFKTAATNTHDLINTQVCQSNQCDPNCGAAVGYNVIQGTLDDPNGFHYVDPPFINHSHDLRFAVSVASNFNKIAYNIKYDGAYGTPDMPNSGCNTKDCIINTVSDMCGFLENCIPFYNVNYTVKKYELWTQKAVMHVYSDGRPYTFASL
jgi:hypothetical protein